MRLYLFSLLFIFVTVSCQSNSGDQKISSSPTFDKLIAVIHSINDSDVSGVVYFEKVESGVQVTAEVNGLTGEKHGFHIHQYGDCTEEDGTSTGGHFNPRGVEHGAPESTNRHMGAMGNLVVNEEGIGIRDYIDPIIVLNEIIGRGIIVHAGEDDLTSQPSGAAGARIGCGVIGISGN